MADIEYLFRINEWLMSHLRFCRASLTRDSEGPFTLRTSTDFDVPKGRTSTSVTARQRASTSVDMRERTSTSVDVPHRTLTDTYNICKCYMLYVNDIQRHYLRHYLRHQMQIKHVIISNLIIGCYYCGNRRWRAFPRGNVRMVRYNRVKMTLKSKLSWFVRCMTSDNARQRAQCECNGALGLHAFD